MPKIITDVKALNLDSDVRHAIMRLDRALNWALHISNELQALNGFMDNRIHDEVSRGIINDVNHAKIALGYYGDFRHHG